MGKSLHKYVDIKTHQILKEKTYQHIKIKGNYNREDNEISIYEKNDKIFNWKRPTAIIEENTVTINCIPGDDYIKHYYYLINTFLQINNIKNVFTTYELPGTKHKKDFFNNYDFLELKNSDYLILGHIDKIGVFEEKKYITIKDFKYKIGKINGKKVSLLGAEFSLRGDFGGYLIENLTQYGIKNIIYIGKVGGIQKNIEPNKHIATGNNSIVNGKTIFRKNLFTGIKGKNIIHGKHYTSKSIILENKKRLKENNEYDFVDPEIGQFAKFANKNGIGFSYIHLISNNLNNELYKEDLSNERKKETIKKRKEIFKQIGKILLKII